MVRNIALTIEYCGINYSGWQIQQNAPTVQGEVERALSELCGEDIHVCGCSRTDAGVHGVNDPRRPLSGGADRVPAGRYCRPERPRSTGLFSRAV